MRHLNIELHLCMISFSNVYSILSVLFNGTRSSIFCIGKKIASCKLYRLWSLSMCSVQRSGWP
uniref:Uncharacterized protein n=1 Tax=Arundo donax TaxID=35708 RepID=A0A0A9GFU5_ARUDO